MEQQRDVKCVGSDGLYYADEKCDGEKPEVITKKQLQNTTFFKCHIIRTRFLVEVYLKYGVWQVDIILDVFFNTIRSQTKIRGFLSELVLKPHYF